jgi:hypothetical protein
MKTPLFYTISDPVEDGKRAKNADGGDGKGGSATRRLAKAAVDGLR